MRPTPGAISAAAGTSAGGSFIGGLHGVSTVASTVPATGDVNPYGVAVIPRSRGDLTAGDVLVSNFNNAPTAAAPGGEQGRGTTIVEVSPGGQQKLFATIPANSVRGGVGLTTALVALRSGWVIVGSLPTADGTSATTKPGELFVLDAFGHVREVIRGYGIVEMQRTGRVALPMLDRSGDRGPHLLAHAPSGHHTEKAG